MAKSEPLSITGLSQFDYIETVLVVGMCVSRTARVPVLGWVRLGRTMISLHGHLHPATSACPFSKRRHGTSGSAPPPVCWPWPQRCSFAGLGIKSFTESRGRCLAQCVPILRRSSLTQTLKTTARPLALMKNSLLPRGVMLFREVCPSRNQ